MATLIIASTTEGAGKTAIAAALATRFAASDRKVALGKAWADDPSSDPDAAALHALAPEAEAITAVALNGDQPATAQVGEIAGRLNKVAAGVPVSVIEGRSGDTGSNLALAEAVDGLVVLVARLEDDIAGQAQVYGSRLAGVIINGVPRYREASLQAEVLPALAEAGIPVLGWLPEDRRLLAPTVDLVAEHLEGQYALWKEHSGRLIDNFLIGGMILDWGPLYFSSQENVGVVVRGDRPDIQLAAVQTGTVQAMILTKGIPPIEYVYYEADQREIPVVVVATDTNETAAKLESLLPKIRFDHPEKLQRLLELADGRLDFDAIEAAAVQPATR
ncbi:MAG: DRTGG domain-containing protein [Dehalococcoidia bacterium]